MTVGRGGVKLGAVGNASPTWRKGLSRPSRDLFLLQRDVSGTRALGRLRPGIPRSDRPISLVRSQFYTLHWTGEREVRVPSMRWEHLTELYG